ncbi:hypothetical protein [Candidatus Clostridium stratigraminis]|uniref:Tetratricopeptide repeat protein n=1 Tax=Candidatus Clostridium stratigraminis TaxID=3381661 RepID=A0ABW8SYC5_9CLOT
MRVNNSSEASRDPNMAKNEKTYIKLSEEVNKARRLHTNFLFAIFICLFFGFGNPIFLIGTAALTLYVFISKNARQRRFVAAAVSSLQSSKIAKAKDYLEKARNIADNQLIKALENDINKIENTGNKETEVEDNNLKFQTERNFRAEELEKQGDIKAASELYEENIKDGFPGIQPYDRLQAIYKKQKNYNEELRVINKAIEVFDNLYQNCDIKIKKELYLETAQKYKKRLKKLNIDE